MLRYRPWYTFKLGLRLFPTPVALSIFLLVAGMVLLGFFVYHAWSASAGITKHDMLKQSRFNRALHDSVRSCCTLPLFCMTLRNCVVSSLSRQLCVSAFACVGCHTTWNDSLVFITQDWCSRLHTEHICVLADTPHLTSLETAALSNSTYVVKGLVHCSRRLEKVRQVLTVWHRYECLTQGDSGAIGLKFCFLAASRQESLPPLLCGNTSPSRLRKTEA